MKKSPGKILIICQFFAPDNSVASVRPTKFAKYLHKNHSYSVDVLQLCGMKMPEDPKLAADLKHVDNVCKVGISTQSFSSPSSPETDSFLSRLKRKSASLAVYLEQYRLMRKNVRHAMEVTDSQLDIRKYDVVLSSAGPFLSHRVACCIKRKNPSVVWIADFRDPDPDAISGNFLVRTVAKRIVKRVTGSADCIIGATRGCFENMEIYSGRRCAEILNGFDPEDGDPQPAPEDKKSITFSYTGTLHTDRTDIEPIFKAIREVSEELDLDRDRLKILYAGRMETEFLRQARRCGLEQNVESFGFVSRSRAMEIQHKSDILLLGSFDIGRQKDVITGKFYEYLFSGKPILCTVSGTNRGTRLKQMFDELACGYCWEGGNSAEDDAGLKEYLKNLIKDRTDTGKLNFSPDREKIKKYDYRNIAGELNSLIEQLLPN